MYRRATNQKRKNQIFNLCSRPFISIRFAADVAVDAASCVMESCFVLCAGKSRIHQKTENHFSRSKATPSCRNCARWSIKSNFIYTCQSNFPCFVHVHVKRYVNAAAYLIWTSRRICIKLYTFVDYAANPTIRTSASLSMMIPCAELSFCVLITSAHGARMRAHWSQALRQHGAPA